MQLIVAGLDLIDRSEGFSSHTYKDNIEFPTIGYGHRLLQTEVFPDGIDEQKATTMLVADVRTAEQAIARLVKVPLSHGQFDALVDFRLNLGAGRLASSTLLESLNSGRYDNADLKTRRQAEIELWHTKAAAWIQTGLFRGLSNFKPVIRLQVAFASEPVFHGRLQAIERYAIACFENAVGSRKGVIEERIVREVAHGEVIDPRDGARVVLARSINAHHRKSPHKHVSNLPRSTRRRTRRLVN